MKYEWRESNKQPYLYVSAGNRYDLGYAIGKGLKDQIVVKQKMIEMLLDKVKDTPASGLFNEDILNSLANHYREFIPKDDMDEIRGMHEGFVDETNMDITFDQILIQTLLIDILYQLMSKLPPGVSLLEGCTNFGVINLDGSTTHGQNYDADGRMKAMNAFVHHKLGDEECFLYRAGADLGTATGKNKLGVCMTVSVIQSNVTAPIMIPRGVLVRRALRKDNAYEAMQVMTDEKGQSPFSYNLVISDEKTIVASQATPFESRVSYVKNQIVQSNQYDYFDWIKYLKKPSYSKKRQLYSENLLDSIYSRYGRVDNEDLLEILKDKPVICRTASNDGIGTTILFLTRESFGHGNPHDNSIGRIPF